VRVTPERDCWLLVVNVDVQGNVYVIYPHKPGDLRRIPAGETVTAVQMEAAPPLGTEIIQVFGFSDKPEGYDTLPGTVLLKDRQLDSLTGNLERSAAVPGRSQARRVTFTAKR
jgi:hypothetical protein